MSFSVFVAVEAPTNPADRPPPVAAILLENVLYVRIGNTSQDLHGNDAYQFIKKRFHF